MLQVTLPRAFVIIALILGELHKDTVFQRSLILLFHIVVFEKSAGIVNSLEHADVNR